MHEMQNNFENLPADALKSIFLYLVIENSDYFTMAGVCTNWDAIHPNKYYLIRDRLIEKYDLNPSLFTDVINSEGTNFRSLYIAIKKIKIYQIAPLNNKLQILFLSDNTELIKQKLQENPKLGHDHRFDHVVPSEARNLLQNHGDPSSQAPQDDVIGRNGSQGPKLLDWTDCNGANLLHYLALSGDIEGCKFVIKQYPHLNKQDYKGRNLLHYLALSGNLAAIQYGLENYPNLNKFWGTVVTDKDGRNVLHFTLLSGNVTASEYVLTNYPELNEGLFYFVTDNKGRNSLHYAAWGGDMATIELIQKKFPSLVPKKDADGRTLLHYTVMSNNIKTIKRIFKFEDPWLKALPKKIKDNYDANPMHYAVKTCDIDIIDYFFKNFPNWDVVDSLNKRLMHYAVETTDIAVVKCLYAHSRGTKLNARCNRDKTPLYIAAEMGSITITEFLLDLPDIDVNGGYSYFEQRSFQSSYFSYELFLVSLDTTEKLTHYAGKTPALINQDEQYYVIYKTKNSDKILSYKLSQSDELNNIFCNNPPEKILFCSGGVYQATAGEIYASKIFQQERIEINAPYKNFQFGPLCAAVKEGHREIIKLLLKHQDIQKKDALYVTAILTKKEMVELLLDAYSNRNLEEIAEVLKSLGYFESSDEIKDMLGQPLKVKKCIEQAEFINTDPINEQLAKIFWSYAHPPLLSLNYRHDHLQMIAEQISIRLEQHNDWNFEACLDYITGICSKESSNSLGTFRGLLNLLEKIKTLDLGLQSIYLANINRR